MTSDTDTQVQDKDIWPDKSGLTEARNPAVIICHQLVLTLAIII